MFSGNAVTSGIDWMLLRRLLVRNWDQGLVYMLAVLAILLVHEMGHFIATLIYRIPATVPIFLPFPFNPVGTLGAVIGMEGMQADRRQIFDIGIAGPLAGLVVALPMAIIGIGQLDLTVPPGGQMAFECPLAFQWMMEWLHVPGYQHGIGQGVWFSQLNPWFAAAWVGFLVTGLNMMPVGQLDGGHVTHCLFGRYAYWLAECIIVFAIAFMVWRGIPHLVIMVLLLLVMGTRHPPTRDDSVALGWPRIALGLVSLSIPLLCFPPNIFKIAF
jgi:membrane-associated protease RseP (regulator of RpoE activity)